MVRITASPLSIYIWLVREVETLWIGLHEPSAQLTRLPPDIILKQLL